jgi:hypothetical protein
MGMDPVWGRDVGRLSYGRIMMEVPVTVETTFTSGNPAVLFRTDTAAGQALALPIPFSDRTFRRTDSVS